MATAKRTPADIRADIARIRAGFIGNYADRAVVLEEAIVARRAEVAAERIVELQDALAAAK